MKMLKMLWSDEAGVLLSAEAAVVGTVAVIGISTGLSVVSEAVNRELQETGFAIRSLDQSYTIPSRSGCGASTAGSSYTQPPVKQALADLQKTARQAEQAEKAQAERLKEQMQKKEDPRKKPNKTKPNQKKPTSV
ncbi:MAG: hypothetical protein KDA89_10680 [Planctomycetaceae bacterium]|nr:hypothetical protein [Planctomycetaceae bacterium]